jgi:hypothetical protein
MVTDRCRITRTSLMPCLGAAFFCRLSALFHRGMILARHVRIEVYAFVYNLG